MAAHFNHIICNDNNKYLIALLSGIQNGYQLPDDLSEEQYQYIREHKDEDPVMTGFAGFGCSFGGKFFGGYGRSKNRSHASESKRALLRDNAYLKDAVFTCLDYRKVDLPEGSVIYADPPYHETTQYNGETFNTNKFWQYSRETSQTHLMFISELKAPDDFIPIWSKELIRTLDKNKGNYFKSTEYLYVHKRWYEKLRKVTNE